MTNIRNPRLTEPSKNAFSRLLKTIGGKINSIFEPEEVEVTVKSEGNKVRYTYTKVPHKEVA